MASSSVDNPLGVVDKRFRRGGTNPMTSATVTNTWDISSMRARLKVISPATYTDAYLDKMTANDMVYAIRKADEAAGI